MKKARVGWFASGIRCIHPFYSSSSHRLIVQVVWHAYWWNCSATFFLLRGIVGKLHSPVNTYGFERLAWVFCSSCLSELNWVLVRSLFPFWRKLVLMKQPFFWDDPRHFVATGSSIASHGELWQVIIQQTFPGHAATPCEKVGQNDVNQLPAGLCYPT